MPVPESFNIVAGLMLRNKCSAVNFTKYIGTPVLQSSSGRLILQRLFGVFRVRKWENWLMFLRSKSELNKHSIE